MFAALGMTQDSLALAIDNKLAPYQQQGALVGATVVSATEGTVLYERNANMRLMPASNQKLVSTIYALARLGTDFKPTMRFWKEGAKLIVDAPGAPMTTYADLKTIRAKLGKVTTVYVKQAYRPMYPPSWELDDMPNRYAAPVTALTVDRSSFELWGANGKAFFEPAGYGAIIRRIQAPESKVEFDPFKGVAKVFGPIGAERKRLDTLAIAKPDVAACQVLGGQYAEFVGELPTREPDAILVGPTIAETVQECLVKSDNQLAEQLLLMAAASEGPLGADPYKLASERATQFLVKTVGIAEQDFKIDDGSGLSRHNLITPRMLATIYRYGLKTFGPAYASWMALPGKGTLASRLEGSTFRGKTGTLDMVANLTGSVSAKNGTTLVISLVFNHFRQPASEIRATQDQVVRIIEESFGTVLDLDQFREKRLPHSRNRLAYGDRLRGPSHDRRAPRPGQDRRVEPDHEAAHRA